MPSRVMEGNVPHCVLVYEWRYTTRSSQKSWNMESHISWMSFFNCVSPQLDFKHSAAHMSITLTLPGLFTIL